MNRETTAHKLRKKNKGGLLKGRTKAEHIIVQIEFRIHFTKEQIPHCSICFKKSFLIEISYPQGATRQCVILCALES